MDAIAPTRQASPDTTIRRIAIDLDLLACIRAAREIHQLPPSVISGDEGVVISSALAATSGGHSLIRPWMIARREETRITVVGVGDAVRFRAALDLASPMAQSTVLGVRELPYVEPVNEERLRFEVRVCPTVNRTRGSEIDVYLAAVARGGLIPPREQVYVTWLRERLRGARLLHAQVRSFTIVSAYRPTHGDKRRWVERRYPDVTLAGSLVVEDAAIFRQTLCQGIGRQRAYGRGWVWTELTT